MNKFIRILNANAVAIQLSRDEVTEGMQIQYLLAVQLITALSLYLSLSYQYANSLIFFTEAFIYFSVTIVGLFYCYKLNGGSEGKDIIKRFTCLSLPISIQVTFLVWGGTYVYGWFIDPLVVGHFGNAGQQLGDVIYSSIILFGEAWFFFRLCHYLGSISNSRESKGLSRNKRSKGQP